MTENDDNLGHVFQSLLVNTYVLRLKSQLKKEAGIMTIMQYLSCQVETEVEKNMTQCQESWEDGIFC